MTSCLSSHIEMALVDDAFGVRGVPTTSLKFLSWFEPLIDRGAFIFERPHTETNIHLGL